MNRSSAAYKRLGELVDDLDGRKILQQVQFCIPGKKQPCNGKGEYFIADLVFVKYNARNDVVDMIIADSKLSELTDLTDGQKIAKNGIGEDLTVRSREISQDINKRVLATPLKSGNSIENTAFYKIFGDGNGNFLGIK